MDGKIIERDIYLVTKDYLKIIPENDSVKEYRSELKYQYDKIGKRMMYAAPEEIPVFWDNVNGVLAKYNDKFIKEDWAKAILHICRYDYNNKYVEPYMVHLTHEYTKKN